MWAECGEHIHFAGVNVFTRGPPVEQRLESAHLEKPSEVGLDASRPEPARAAHPADAS